ncbi:DsbA family protein [Natronococcus jeotgali]|uniref:DSBA oxidoreductase n=1 Tax=Natronococcus jeotgali DSM 18795 TaxID=1227498 RepID=L9WSC2_9EURY|nr:thioredoxin domain-containing protein [Natronococcus jeotgali]ELY52365.1 DSBA oxidoreductase [Natronococcus jeotgali DSM 18795]
MNRRSVLTLTAAGASAALAGCAALFDASLPDALADVDPDPDQLPTPTIGSGGVSIDVYEDFACPHCRDFEADVVPELEERVLDPGTASYRHRDFVLPADENRSVPMANAARAVQAATGTDDEPTGQFFSYKRAVMEAGTPDDEELAAIAEETIGIDPSVVADALEENTYYPTLAAEWEAANGEGIDRTPTVVVDGESVEDPLDADGIVAAVEDAR